MFQFNGEKGTNRPVVIRVMKRSGNAFEGEYETEGTYRWQLGGTIENGNMTAKLTKPLNEAAEKTGAGNAQLTGKLTDGKLSLKYEDHDSKADMQLTRQK